MAPLRATSGAGLSEENPKNLLGYRYPMVATYASTPDEVAYAMIKAVDESFEDIKDATALGEAWSLEASGLPPADAAWHPGSIRYLKEKNLWTAEAEEWNKRRLARMEQVQEAWDQAVAEFNEMRADEEKKGNKIDPDQAWPEYWEKYRAQHLSNG